MHSFHFFFVRKNLIWLQPLKAWDINFFCLWQWLSPLAWLFLIMSKGEKRLCYYVIIFVKWNFFLFKFQVWFVLECWLLNIDLWMLNLQNLLLLIWFWFGINDFGCLVAYFLYLIFMDSWIFGAYDFLLNMIEYWWLDVEDFAQFVVFRFLFSWIVIG